MSINMLLCWVLIHTNECLAVSTCTGIDMQQHLFGVQHPSDELPTVHDGKQMCYNCSINPQSFDFPSCSATLSTKQDHGRHAETETRQKRETKGVERQKRSRDAMTPEGCASVIYQLLKATADTFTHRVIRKHISPLPLESLHISAFLRELRVSLSTVIRLCRSVPPEPVHDLGLFQCSVPLLMCIVSRIVN